MTQIPTGRPAAELSDEELETQGKQLHDSRNWAFLHGTAAQFETHTQRMLELEQEYLRRHPKRTWQGVEASEAEHVDDPVGVLLRRVDAAGGRMNKLELHQLARVLGISRADLAELYRSDLLGTEKQERVITPSGRDRASGRNEP
jgi:hypothetical protein